MEMVSVVYKMVGVVYKMGIAGKPEQYISTSNIRLSFNDFI